LKIYLPKVNRKIARNIPRGLISKVVLFPNDDNFE
jgi:hypothetical protein